MGNELQAGLVGCGSLSQRGILPHLSLPDARQSVRLVAVADAVEERARESAQRFDVPAHFTSLEEMLATVDLDLVLIATPIPDHFQNAMAAIVAGKHVYVQKTMTTTLAEADELLAARDRAGVKLAAAVGYELCSTTRELRRVVCEGTLGHIYVAYTYTLGFGHEHESIRSGAGALAAIDPSWYYRPGAGPLPDVTVYALHLATEEQHVYADIMDLVEAILADRPPRATGEQARHVVEIVEAAQRAARTGQTQSLTSAFEPR